MCFGSAKHRAPFPTPMAYPEDFPMNRRCLLLSGLSALAAVTFASAAYAQAVKLTRTPRKGELVKYRFEVAGDVANVPFTVTSRIKQEVTEVKDAGEFVTSEIAEESKVLVMGAEQASPPSMPTLVTRTQGNRLTDFKHEGDSIFSNEVQRLLASLSEVLLPEKTLANGESWETEIPNPVVAGRNFKVKATFAGTEKIGDLETWKVTQTATADLADGKLEREATYWLDPANGQLVKQEASIKNAPSRFGPMNWKETQERLKP